MHVLNIASAKARAKTVFGHLNEDLPKWLLFSPIDICIFVLVQPCLYLGARSLPLSGPPWPEVSHMFYQVLKLN